MIFDLSENVGVWFDFPGGGRVQLRAITASDVLRISRETTEIRPFLYEPEDAKGQKLPPRVINHEIPDIDRRDRLFNECAIIGWEGFFDAENKPIPCTPEMKTALMRMKDRRFRDFVNDKLRLLADAENERAEEAEKNSSAG